MELLSASFFPVLITLIISSLALFCSLFTKEEVIKVFSAGIATLSLLCCLFLSHWLILLVLIIGLVSWKHLSVDSVEY